jgi:hypothetical protein
MTRRYAPLIANSIWLCVAILSLFVIGQVASDYLGAISSLQNFVWRVESFTVEGADPPQAQLILAAQNRSRVVMRVRELELYVQANETDVGKTYPPFPAQTLQPGEHAKLNFTISLDPAQLRFAQTQTNGPNQWSILGTYKITTPFAEDDFFYHLNLPIEFRP